MQASWDMWLSVTVDWSAGSWARPTSSSLLRFGGGPSAKIWFSSRANDCKRSDAFVSAPHPIRIETAMSDHLIDPHAERAMLTKRFENTAGEADSSNMRNL